GHLRPFSPSAPVGVNPLALTELSRDLLRQRGDWKHDRGYVFLVTDRASASVMGRVALNGVMRGAFLNAYLGYWIDRDRQNLGLATEAVGMTCDFAFEVLGLHRVQAAVVPSNAPSRRVLDKL